MEENFQRPEVIAKLFGVSVRRVQQLTQEGILSSVKIKGSAGRMYNLETNIQAYIKHLSEKAYGKSKTDKELELKNKKLEVEIALKESQNELHRLKTDIQAGRYIAIEEVRNDYDTFLFRIKSFVLEIPSRASIALNGFLDPINVRKFEKELKDDAYILLNSFADSVTVKGKEENETKEKEI